jgi:5-methylthioribose kinase
MIELTTENAVDYLRERGLLGAGSAQAELLAGGVSNLVLRIKQGENRFVLKQSRPRLRTREDWFSNLDRIYREQEVMEALAPLLPNETVPRVLFSERADYVFAMSHAPKGSTVWKEELLAGKVDLPAGKLAGRILGQIHEATSRAPHVFQRFMDDTVFHQLRIDPFYRRIQERRPEVRELVEAVIVEMGARREALCHGDYSPKNLLRHTNGFTLVDYETAHWGDPTMDLGFFLSHLLLKACRAAPDCAFLLDLTRTFWQGYAEEVAFRQLPELVARGVGHLGVCLLARIDGTSPVDYLPGENRREAVRRLGRRFLKLRPGDWEDVLGLTVKEYASISQV